MVVQWLTVCLPVQRTRFNPQFRKIPYTVEHLSLCTTVTEAFALEPVLHNKRCHHNGKPMHS